MTALARFVLRRRRAIVFAWIALTLVGAYSANAVSKRWLEQFSIPGYSAYEANQRTLKTFGTGENAPLVAVFHSSGDVTKVTAIKGAIAAAAKQNPGSRVSSYFSTDSDAYISRDRHTTFAELYPPGNQGFNGNVKIGEARAALKNATPSGVTSYLTGRDALQEASNGGDNNGPSVLLEALVGGLGALVILLFVFGTVPAVLIPIGIAIASILNTFTLIYLLTYVTSVSLIVQFLVALVGLGVAIDYSLLMIFRFREELANGEGTETALIETMRHAGRSVIVSGSTVAIGLLSMVILPIPVIRSIGIGGMLIPAVSVLTSITLLPALLGMLGHRINRLRVMPKRIVERQDPTHGFWHRWAQIVVRRPIPVAVVGIAIVALLLVPGVQLHPAEAQLKDFPGKGDAINGRQALAAAGISPGVMKPYVILAEAQPGGKAGRPDVRVPGLVARLKATPGIYGVGAEWRRDGKALLEVFPSSDSASNASSKTISRLQKDILPAAETDYGGDVQLTLGGISPEDRDFVHAVYGKFPYVLAFVILLTFVLLMRAFRSILLPLKAVVLNLVSLGAAYGIIVFIFQWGHGSDAIWGVPATGAIISWIPLMIFAFLYGLSMDYEVFMLTRMREEYDESHDTATAVELGLARTGKLVTSAALVLMFAFFVLSSSPGVDITQFGIGLAAGIIFDATVIRTLLVPSLVRLFGRWNWWLPHPVARILRVPAAPLRPAGAAAGGR
ncbi:MAG: MMPL family transporter [Actinobacteria bacterium]|nr:MAG: MMPL family transporter [Actinomycetota bacterium]